MTHDIYFVKTRINKQKQTDVLLYVNYGCGLNNFYSIKCNKQHDMYLCFKGKKMYFRQNQDRTGSDHTGPDGIGPDWTGLDHGSVHGSDHRK